MHSLRIFLQLVLQWTIQYLQQCWLQVFQWLFSRRLLESSANADIVVSESQNPTAVKREYFPSRFYCCDIMTNAPRINAPTTFTIKTLTGNVLKSKGDSVTLNLRYAPSTWAYCKKNKFQTFHLYPTHQQALLVLFGEIYAQFILISL